MYARRAMRRAVYQKMNQPGKQKSALQKFFGWYTTALKGKEMRRALTARLSTGSFSDQPNLQS